MATPNLEVRVTFGIFTVHTAQNGPHTSTNYREPESISAWPTSQKSKERRGIAITHPLSRPIPKFYIFTFLLVSLPFKSWSRTGHD